ncbi:unnamed protein product [Phytophthora fragariaefolia]|uniref:Unnamed protein product n=1 Tax=Phytophthora fragariaefolia TaxID=1490495 RepID=A0A9W6X3E2_9STRA|nr:unnamed protein product [Phytophthora fragariaefolia]
MELLRAARDARHPSAQAAAEAADRLLADGLRDALLDELHGRQFTQPPTLGVGAAERRARAAWELQLLQEEALLRELVLLTLVASREKPTLESAVRIAKTVHRWDSRVLEDVVSPSTLALPEAQLAVRRLTRIGALVALRLLHSAAAEQGIAALRQATDGFFLADLCALDAAASPVPGVLLLAWATLLGRQYRETARSNSEMKELEQMLQQTLAAAEQTHSFHHLNALLRSLVFRNDCADSDNGGHQPFLQPWSLHAKTLWALPDVAAWTGLRRENGIHSDYQSSSSDSSSIYQLVVAAFLNDMLSSLGYMENLEDAQQLNAMVKFVLPVLSNAAVAHQVLGIDAEDSMSDTLTSGGSAALRELLSNTRILLPNSLLSSVQMLTALSCNYGDMSSSAVLRQILKYFNKPCAGLEDQMVIRKGVRRQLPPTEYFRAIEGESERIQCTRSFAYEDNGSRLVVPVETVGIIVRSGDEFQVEWFIADDYEGRCPPCLWDLIMVGGNRLVAGLQSGSFSDLHRTNAEDVSLLTAFFEFIVQLSKQHDGGQFMLVELERRWGEARLRRWWIDHQLPSPETYVSLLVRQHVSLPMLLTASRESLVSWGIHDRFIREQVLTRIGVSGVDSFGERCTLLQRSDALTNLNPFGIDGGSNLIRLLLGVLGGFLHASSGQAIGDMMADGGSIWPGAGLHLVAASFIALRSLLATPTGVDLLMSPSLGGTQEDCINIIVKTAKKLFEVQERTTGEYPVVLATQDIFMSVIRWLFSKEAETLATSNSAETEGYDKFIVTERLWVVGAAEFAIEVLSTHESWKFVSSSDRCEVTEGCFRLLYVLVCPRKYVNERNHMVPAFEAALRETLSTDMSLLMKLLRSSCAVLSSMEGHMGNWNSIATTDNDKINDVSDQLENDGHFPLVYETENDSAGVKLVQLESLVTMSLRFLALIVGKQTTSVNAQAARNILLTPIDDGGPKKHKSLTIVTLCGGYLGYSVEKAPGIAYWALKILQQAAVVLDYRLDRETRDISSMHSLVALFHGYHDLALVRGMFSRLLRVSSPLHLALRKEVVEMLTLCLEHQPGFLALLLFGDDRKIDSTTKSTTNDNIEGDPLPFVALLERFFGSSEQLLEKSSDLFCALLTFLVQVWKGAIHNGLGVHLKIIAALRERSMFWPNVTRVLKIHMPLESVEERGLLDMELAAATVQGKGDVKSQSEAYTGRSSAYGYLARGLILQLVSYEWHSEASKKSDHPLVDVLESFRKEGLYSHWLRTFTRLDYSPAQFEQYASSSRRACNDGTPTSNILGDVPVGSISLYLEGFICDASTLKWQLSAGGDIKLQASSVDVRALKLVQWSNLQAAYLHAQLFSLGKWKVFMELCSLQAGSAAKPSENTSEVTTPRQLKRKESMISSPPRSSVMNSSGSSDSSSRMRLPGLSSSASCSASALAHSRFVGDRTSFGMIQVLADVINTRVVQHENQDETLDYFVLLHLRDLVELLVSMLHHQLCVVVRKTRDPKLSQTRQRLDGARTDPNLKVNVGATLELLAVIEKTTSALRDSIMQIAGGVEMTRLGVGSKLSASSTERSAVSLIACLVKDFDKKLKVVTDGLYKSLFTAALLLVRHLRKINRSRDIEMDSVGPPKSLLQLKLIAHCMSVITLCDNQLEPAAATEALFQLSWSLLQEVLDSFNSVDAPKSKLCISNAVQLNPFVKELEYDQKGFGALVHLLAQRFRPSSYSKEMTARQEEACQVLRGLAAVAWNSNNAALCQRVMLTNSGSSRLRFLSILATQLLPLLQGQMEREQAASNLRGYVFVVNADMENNSADKNLERSVAHRMWCLVLDFVGGLLRVQPTGADSDDTDVWAFMSHAEPLLLEAVQPSTCQRLTRAVVVEHQSLLRFLNALSGTASRRKHWRQAFPSNAVVLMEQSRQILRRACVLLGSSSTEIGLMRKERTQKGKSPKSKPVVGLSLFPKSPRSPRSPSSFTYAHQTLLHDHLQAVHDVEKRDLTGFHRGMETEIVEIVRLANLLLTKWTNSVTDRDAILVVDGVRYVDEEQLAPLLAFVPPSEARSMNSDLGLGHLSLAMDFMLSQLLDEEENFESKQPKAVSVLANAVDTCALLFLKTYLLHAEQYELAKRDREELSRFFREFNARISGDKSGITVAVDTEFLEHIGKVCS